MAAAAAQVELVQCIGRMNNVEASASCKRGRGLIKIDNCPIELLDPEFIRQKANEIITRIGRGHFECVDMEVRIQGGQCLKSRAYAIRQAIANALVAFYRNYVNDRSKIKEIMDKIVRFDRSLLVADPNELRG